MVTDGKLRFEITVEAAVDLPRARETCEETGQSIEEVISDTVTDVLRGAGTQPDYMELSISFGPSRVLP